MVEAGAKVRAALQLGPRDQVEEVGVFPQPGAATRAREVRRLGETWADAARPDREAELIALGRERSISEEPRIQASLPRGKARRVDDVPGVLLFEAIPAPKLLLGPVAKSPSGAWIADIRGEPAALVMEEGDRELALWGEDGEMRLFSIERAE